MNQRYWQRQPTTRDHAMAFATAVQRRRYLYEDQQSAAAMLAAEFAIREGWVARSIVNGREAFIDGARHG